jgi:predicted metal-dependent hydrolase
LPIVASTRHIAFFSCGNVDVATRIGNVDSLFEEAKIGETVAGFYVRRMNARWGSCYSQAGTIRLNSDLARTPRKYLEYIVVHEMIHILEPNQSERFQTFMNHFVPGW